MSTLSSNILYWLVNHPTILYFQWNQGQTLGSSTQFLFLTVMSYLCCTMLLSSVQIPKISPHTLKQVTVAHNIVILILSFTMAIGCMLSFCYHAPHSHWLFCLPPRTSPQGPLFFWGYIFYLSKIYEFMDTLLIILSNSKKRLTFLHVYHHAVVVIVCYSWVQTSQSIFPLGVMGNATVHVLMYTYYLSCTLGAQPKWKKLVTRVQITQFAGSFVVFALVLYHHFFISRCSGIPSLCFSVAFAASLFILFVDFYSKSYANANKMNAKSL